MAERRPSDVEVVGKTHKEAHSRGDEQEQGNQGVNNAIGAYLPDDVAETLEIDTGKSSAIDPGVQLEVEVPSSASSMEFTVTFPKVEDSSAVAGVVSSLVAAGGSSVDDKPCDRIDARASVDEKVEVRSADDGAEAADVATKDSLSNGSDQARPERFDRTVEEGARVIPTPPKTRSNPVNSTTPPRKGSRGGNLALSKSFTVWDEHKSPGAKKKETKTTSPRNRPQVQRSASAGRTPPRVGDSADGDGSGDYGDDLQYVAGSKGRTACDEYVLDEDRKAPRGGIFAKIPGLNHHIFTKHKKETEPTKFRAPHLTSGTVRKYDADEAENAAFRYPECRGAVYRPSYADDGSFDDLPSNAPLLSEPPQKLRLERARGYHGGGFYPSTDNNAYFLGENYIRQDVTKQSLDSGSGIADGNPDHGVARGQSRDLPRSEDTERHVESADQSFFEVVYPTAALVVMHRFRRGAGGIEESVGEKSVQRFFSGHGDDVTALAVHPGGAIVASGQVGREPPVLVWDSTTPCVSGEQTLNRAEATLAVLGGHQRKICCLDFSHDGHFLCSVGADGKSTTRIWDWKKGEAIAEVHAGTGPIHAFRFNPYQAYGVPSEEPCPGQAPHIDDACYCLVSIGLRHAKFWLLTRGKDDRIAAEFSPGMQSAGMTRTSMAAAAENRSGNFAGSAARMVTFTPLMKQDSKPRAREGLTWILDGSMARLNEKGGPADFTCVTFIDDSPPLQTWGPGDAVMDHEEESDRSSGRAVLGTAAGDLYVFIQRGVRLIPREFAADMKRRKERDNVFLDPWWLLGPGHEITAKRRLWDVDAELVNNIPNSLKAANEVMLTGRAKERLNDLEKRMAVKSMHPGVMEDLKRQHNRLQYEGPITGHQGGITALAFNRETGKLVSAGANGRIVQWQAFFFVPPPPPQPMSTASAAFGSSLAGKNNAKPNAKEKDFIESPRNPRVQRVRCTGINLPVGDNQTTFARDDHGEISLSGFLPLRACTGGRDERKWEYDDECGGAKPSEALSLPQGSHGKSLVWSRDGTRLLAGISTNALLVMEYPGDKRDAASDERVEASSPGEGVGERIDEDGTLCKVSDRAPGGAKVTALVQGHYGNVIGVSVFEGLQEYVTAGHDRVVTIWDADLNLPVARCVLPSPVSCVACSPWLDEVAVGTIHSNEIFILKVHRTRQEDTPHRTHGKHKPANRGADQCDRGSSYDEAAGDEGNECKITPGQRGDDAPELDNDRGYHPHARGVELGDAHDPASESGGCALEGTSFKAIRIEVYRSKQLLPSSALCRRWEPDVNARSVFNGAVMGKLDRSNVLTLGGRESVTAGSGRISGGHAAPPFQSPAESKASPARVRARNPKSVTDEPAGKGSAALANYTDTNHSTDSQQRHTHRETSSSTPRDNDLEYGALVATDLQSIQGSNRARGGSLDRNAFRRGLGSACMRYSPSGSHLAIGCKNGCLVIMAVDPAVREGGCDVEDRASKAELPERNGILGDDRVGLTPESGDNGGTDSEEIKENFTVTQRRTRYRRVACLKGHSSRVLHLDWTTDGRFVQTCGQDYQLLHWEILPPIDRSCDGTPGADDFRPRIFLRPFLLRDAHWETWSSTVGWPVQGVFPAYTDNTAVNAVDVCPSRDLLATADDARTIRLLRFPALRGGAKEKVYIGHSSHILNARFTVGAEPTRLITVGGFDSSVMQWIVEDGE